MARKNQMPATSAAMPGAGYDEDDLSSLPAYMQGLLPSQPGVPATMLPMGMNASYYGQPTPPTDPSMAMADPYAMYGYPPEEEMSRHDRRAMRRDERQYRMDQRQAAMAAMPPRAPNPFQTWQDRQQSPPRAPSTFRGATYGGGR